MKIVKKSVNIVVSSKRVILPFAGGSFYYVYIPMTEEEKKMFYPGIANACWRIEIDTKE